MPNDFGRIGIQYFTIFHFNLNRLTAIQAWCIDGNCFTGIKPADRQRLKGSLAEPFLLAIDGYPKLGGKVVKWGKRGN